MPRANRYIVRGRNYHLTHRCHNRSFLLKFGKDRDFYRQMLRERLERCGVALLGYCITSNHTHLLVHAATKDQISGLMQSVEGDFAQAYNIRKKRSGAFWQDRYQATLIEGNRHLWRCLKYIDLNMVRAGVASHPADWDWCGYREYMRLRKRYRLIDREALLRALGDGVDWDGFCRAHGESIDEAIGARDLSRQAMWTESVAVGSKGFLESLKGTLKNRRRTLIEESETDGAWVLREERAEYET